MRKLFLLSLISFFTYSYAQNNLSLEEEPQEKEERKVFEELTEDKKEALLSNLYNIYNAKVAAREAKLAQAISVLQANSSSGTSALNFFYDCYEKVKYTDEGKDRSDFLEWKERNNDKYSETEFKTGLQWNMRWLILELRSTGLDEESDTSDFKSEVEGFMKNYVGNLKVFKGNYKGVTDGTLRGLVWDLYEIRDNKEFNFPKRITNYGSWYQTHRIKPAIEEQSLADLERYWDEYIAMAQLTIKAEMDAAETKDLEEAKLEEFLNETKPKWLMEKAINVYDVGYQEKSVRDSFALLQQYPEHSDYEKWLERLLKVLDPAFTPAIEESQRTGNYRGNRG